MTVAERRFGEEIAALEDRARSRKATKTDAEIIAAAAKLIPLYLEESEMTAGEPEVIGFGEPDER
jgi:hypothetical protein